MWAFEERLVCLHLCASQADGISPFGGRASWGNSPDVRTESVNSERGASAEAACYLR